MKTWAVLLLFLVIAVFLGSIPVAMAVGKYQLCTRYYSEMNAYSCFFTTLPGKGDGK